MTRRQLVKYITRGLQFGVLTRLVKPLTALGAWDEIENTLHYTPLNGRYLKELAIRKRHHGEGRFINPVGPLRSGRFWGLLRWKISRNRYENYLSGQMVQPVNINWSRLKSRSGLSITFIKHAGVIIKEDDIFYYIDPVFDDIGFFFKDYSPRRFPLKQIPPADHILITHGHYDHLDIATLKCFDRATHVISPLGYDDVFDEIGMRNRRALDWYETHESGKHRVTFLPSNHWTMRNPVVGPNRSLWGSYIIETQQGYTIYVSGDTAYFDGFEQIGAQFAIDLAIFNLGAYEPRWFMASSHINPAETVKAFKELKAKKLMIVHWGTFRLGDEPVHFPPRDIAFALREEGLPDSLVPIKHGETLRIVC